MDKNQTTICRVKHKCRVLPLRRLLVAVLWFCVIATVAGPSFAQPLIDSVTSIDSLVINADHVYVAKIIKVRDEPIPGGSKMPGFTFEVDEYLKVPINEKLSRENKLMGMFVSPPTTKYKDWMNRSCQLLIIANDVSTHSPVVIELAPKKADVFTADFRLLHDPSEIIQAAKDAIARTPSNILRLYTFRLMLPSEIYKGTRWEGDYGLEMEVPADSQLEKWAIESLSHESPLNRRTATQALRYFKSEQNAKLIAELLDDPDSTVRYLADETLKRWELEVKR